MRKEEFQEKKVSDAERMGIYKRIDYGERVIKEPVKWANVAKITKTELRKSFSSEEVLQEFLSTNPQYELNQILFKSQEGNVTASIYERAYAVTKQNPFGYRVAKQWLTDEEVAEYLKDTAK